MSDGPHKSLPMRRAWRQLSELADNGTAESDELVWSLETALIRDFNLECPRRLLQELKLRFADQAQASFPGAEMQSFEPVRRLAVGSSFADSVIGFAALVYEQGTSGDFAVERILGLALQQRAEAGLRQVEEHYFRNTTPKHFAAFQKRLRLAEETFKPEPLASRLSVSGRQVARSKKTDLGEGAML